jgi:hypothetical protein
MARISEVEAVERVVAVGRLPVPAVVKIDITFAAATIVVGLYRQ